MRRFERHAAPRSGDHKRRRSTGQALVEFAIVVPLFILLLAAMVDFGMGLYSYMTIITAAREGGRLGITACGAGPCSAIVKARAAAASGGMVGASDVMLSCYAAADTTFSAPYNCDAATVSYGDSVKVTVSYTYHMIWPLAFGNALPLSSAITMVVE